MRKHLVAGKRLQLNLASDKRFKVRHDAIRKGNHGRIGALGVIKRINSYNAQNNGYPLAASISALVRRLRCFTITGLS